ncbi:hypothetical protein GH714_020523 [Hevea brasiliensis]|uniref:GATA transcription factor n=1 Tax=Hevea brasiliensis TaxID=3981 RepID=A0A6A6LKU1_HEVBR|nr:hypothetical protein GH714_020523 [Hevea brasiliensis]
MDAPDFFMGGYYRGGAAAEFFPEKRISDQKPGDHFAVDDLLDFPNEDDAIMTDGFFDNITTNCAATTDSSTFTSNDSSNSSISGNQVGYQSFADSHFSSELCVPYDDLAELEWLSNFVEDSFSTEQNLQANLHILSGSKPPHPNPLHLNPTRNHQPEVAADVVQKMEPKEASNVFIEGLRSIPKMKVEEMEENEHQQKHKLLVVDCNEKAEPEMIESPCQCSLDRSNIEMESPEQTIKEPFQPRFDFHLIMLLDGCTFIFTR